MLRQREPGDHARVGVLRRFDGQACRYTETKRRVFERKEHARFGAGAAEVHERVATEVHDGSAATTRDLQERRAQTEAQISWPSSSEYAAP